MKWYCSTDDEHYAEIGECSRDEAAEYAVNEYACDPGDVVYIMQAEPKRIMRPSAELAIERLMEAMDDEGYYGDDNCEIACDEETFKAAEAELQAAMDAWLDKHEGLFRRPWLFGTMINKEEIVVPEAAQ